MVRHPSVMVHSKQIWTDLKQMLDAVEHVFKAIGLKHHIKNKRVPCDGDVHCGSIEDDKRGLRKSHKNTTIRQKGNGPDSRAKHPRLSHRVSKDIPSNLTGVGNKPSRFRTQFYGNLVCIKHHRLSLGGEGGSQQDHPA